MKVSYPLSLRVSLWLLLNLLLLAALGLGFFVSQGGLGWSALVSGPAGERAQTLFNIIAGEASAASGSARDAVLERFGRAYDADFALFGSGGTRLAGALVTPPPPVRERLELRGPPWALIGRDSERSRRREFAEKNSADATTPPPTPPEKKLPPPPETARRAEPIAPPTPPLDWRQGRFVIRDPATSTFWVGLRVPFIPQDRSGRPAPALLLARVHSLWSLLHLLGLQAWLLAGGGVLLLSILFWLPLVRSITRSIAQLSAATEKIAEGRFDTRVNTRRHDELGQLGNAVNRMASRLDAHMAGQKRFLGDVAHELCSPLARLQMASGILADQAPPSLQPTVADVREEVQQMSALVNELLAFTKAGLQAPATLAPVPLAPLVHATLARENATGRVTLDLPENIAALAEPERLSRALANLVRNAIRYAGDAGPISISASRVGDRVHIAVEDSGPGVPPADLDRLGEPFFRPELARTREGGGVGLGLAIVRSGITACAGEVRFSNRSPHGFRAELRLHAPP